jgi:predicted regulator of Ras-like GTPase activity (Roadblock/LC7/MglB family)
VLSQVRQSAEMFSAGALNELSIRSERLTTIIRPVNEEYFVALALVPEGNFGKGRYLLRVHAPKLVQDLS